MNKNYLCAFFFCLICGLCNAQTPANDPSWNTDTLTMPLYDNFNGTSLKDSLWEPGAGYIDTANYITGISHGTNGTYDSITIQTANNLNLSTLL